MFSPSTPLLFISNNVFWVRIRHVLCVLGSEIWFANDLEVEGPVIGLDISSRTHVFAVGWISTSIFYVLFVHNIQHTYIYLCLYIITLWYNKSYNAFSNVMWGNMFQTCVRLDMVTYMCKKQYTYIYILLYIWFGTAMKEHLIRMRFGLEHNHMYVMNTRCSKT